ncbi:MAG: ABC transporter permease [Cyclobacteriaceae bacterium]|nr:ABC transporter permease [Cyclobacteriaceae bacterium]
MLKSILITALRNIFRNRAFSAINLVGLSISMSLGLLIITVIQEQFTFDTFHADSERIVRINTRAVRADGGAEEYASVPFPLGNAIEQDYGFAESVVRVNRYLNGDAVAGNTTVPVLGLLADPSLLTVFNFPLERGDAQSALSMPSSLVLTHETSVRLFGNADPMGRGVTIKGYGEFQVTGVLAPFPAKTHFEFEVLGSTSLLPVLEKNRIVEATTDSWNNYYGSYVYVKIKEGAKVEEVGQALKAITGKYYADLELETRDKGYEFFVLPLGELTPGPMMSNQMGTGMPMLLVIFLGVLAGIIMLMACFNYTNLMIAKSLSRVREIGIRKVIGARRSQVFVQFVGEAIVFSLLALAASYGLLQLLKPAFRQLNIAREFAVSLGESGTLYLYFLGFAVVTGLLAGFLPSAYLSALKPVSVLRDAGTTRVMSRQALRKGLIVFQFTLSVCFIIVITVIFNQVNYMLEKDYGFNEKDILNVRLQGVAFEKLAAEMERMPGVISMGGVSHRLGTWQDRASDYKAEPGAEPFVMRDFMVDRTYIEQLGLTFVAGRNFDQAPAGERERHVLLNERAVARLGFKSAIDAVGAPLYLNDSTSLEIIGVLKDFHFRPMNYEIGPLALRNNPAEFGFLSARIAPGSEAGIVAGLEKSWKIFDDVHPLEWSRMEDEIDEAYTDSGFVDVVKIVGYISFLAITLACLGMLGMAMYATRVRLKEIGIRKVMGASEGEVVMVLSRGFMLLVVIGACLGTPLGYFLGSVFLDSYAYKAPLTLLALASGFLVMSFLGALTIGSQTWTASRRNPVESLRYE